MARGSSPCGSSGRRDEWTEKTIYRIKWAVGLLWCFTVEFPLIENNQRKWIGKLLTNTWLRTPFFFLCVSFRFSLWCWGNLLIYSARDLRVICKSHRGLVFAPYPHPINGLISCPSGRLNHITFYTGWVDLTLMLDSLLGRRWRLFNLRKSSGDIIDVPDETRVLLIAVLVLLVDGDLII